MRQNCAAVLTFSAICGWAVAADLPGESYEKSVQQFRAGREAKLTRDDGWLTVVALDWLKEGENRVGSNPSFEVPLPKSVPDRVGTIVVHAGVARFIPAPGVPVTYNNQPAREMNLKPDTTPDYDRLAVGRVKFFVIKRGDKLGVRVKDNDSAARKQFTGMRWYPIDPSWRIQAKFTPWDKPRMMNIDTMIGIQEQDESPGYVTFERNGKEYRLEAMIDGKELWFVMRDATSGKSTYAASRFLYSEMPKNGLKQAGPVELDFNRAENPPCVYSDYATCPLPVPQNRLQLAITAGELMYPGHAQRP
jgi:uncharacterized protein (DUF1684 family)